MDVISYSEARANLKSVMDRVVADKTEIIVTRQKAEAVVILSLSEWNSMVETAHLLSSPVNAKRLRRSIEQMKSRKGGTSATSLIREEILLGRRLGRLPAFDREQPKDANSS